MADAKVKKPLQQEETSAWAQLEDEVKNAQDAAQSKVVQELLDVSDGKVPGKQGKKGKGSPGYATTNIGLFVGVGIRDWRRYFSERLLSLREE
jgi:hypothetical protein